MQGFVQASCFPFTLTGAALLSPSTLPWKFTPWNPEPSVGLESGPCVLCGIPYGRGTGRTSHCSGKSGQLIKVNFSHSSEGRASALLLLFSLLLSFLWLFRVPEENLNTSQLNILCHETLGTPEMGTVAHYG